MAGVSSFGFSGTNAHVVLEEGPPARPNAGAEVRSFYCVPLSARSDAALSTIAAQYAQVIASRPELTLANLVCTAGAGRSHFPHRLAVVADSMETAANAMRAFADGKPHPALQAGIVVPGQAREVVFLFAGECSQSFGMGGRLLYDMSSVYRAAIDQCDHLLGPDAAGRTLNSVLWSSSGEIASLDDPAWRQPALFAVQ
jgi:myxalamid-type polyketide synthase MxaB